MTSNKIYPMAYGKVISISSNGFKNKDDLINSAEGRVSVSPELFSELMKLSAIDYGECSLNARTYTTSKTKVDSSSGFSTGFITGLIV